MKASKELMLMTAEAVARAACEEQIEKQGRKEWKQDNHKAALCRLVAGYFDIPLSDPRIAKLHEVLGQHGLGGNASQTRQWLESKDVALIPPADAKTVAANLLLE